MRTYKPKYRDRKSGGLVETPCFYVDFTDHQGARQRLSSGTDDETEAGAFAKTLPSW